MQFLKMISLFRPGSRLQCLLIAILCQKMLNDTVPIKEYTFILAMFFGGILYTVWLSKYVLYMGTLLAWHSYKQTRNQKLDLVYNVRTSKHAKCYVLLVCPTVSNSTLDLIFLLDGSGSVGETNFGIVRNWVINVSRNFDISDRRTQIGVLQYSTYDRRPPYVNIRTLTNTVSLSEHECNYTLIFWWN